MSRRKIAAAFAGIVLAGAAYFFPWRKPGGAVAPARVESGYVDSAQCAGCHQDIARTYRLTGMGRSLYRPRPANTVESYARDNQFYHRASDRYYTMIERDGNFYQRRHQVGFGGKETNVLEVQADYVVGSGNHARTYLHRTAEGRLVELPVSWYAEKGGYWAMSPGYDRPGQQEFRRSIPYDCLFCHDGYPAAEPGSDYRGSDPIFGNLIPEGIDCQRCHGPGRAHIAAASSGRAASDSVRESIRRAIVNPSRLTRDRQLEVCMQCHLETTSRQLPNAIRRFDKGPFSYRPGEPLGDSFLYFDHAPGTGQEGKFEIAHAAYRLRKSACFRASQMTCISCHNPHRDERGPEAEQHYVAVCRSCHSAAHAAGMPAEGDCVTCHMPKRRTEDAVHVVMTDHYIQRKKPQGDLLAALPETRDSESATYRGEVTLYYPDKLPATPESELYLALAQVQQGSDLKSGIPRLRQAIENHPQDGPEFYFELGVAYGKAGNRDEAIHWYEEALHRRAHFVPALKELAVALTAEGRFERAAEVLEETVAVAPDAVMFANLGNLYLQLGRLPRAEQVLRQALSVDAGEPDAHNLLGLASLQTGDRVAAEAHFREAIRIQPDLAPAHNNLANLLAGAKEYTEAEYHFQKAIAANPDYAEAHHSYGILLILLKSYDRALVELKEAVRLMPNLAAAHNDLADVLAAKGRIESALSEYRLALQSNPNYAEAHLSLGLILARKGEAAEARSHLEKAAASSDPAVREAALSALR